MLRQVLWDWNGTLLDDLQYAIGVRNRVFPRFGLPCVESLAQYHSEFTFPVRLYYERAGVTDEIFDDVAHAWMAEYVRGYPQVPLRGDALQTLRLLADAGVKQVMLSATRRDMLLEQMAVHPITPYFSDVLGLGDIYAVSKEEVGRNYLKTCGIPASESVMIGDTLHDAEVARAMGTACILVTGGHHDRAKLETAGVPVASSLSEAAQMALQL